MSNANCALYVDGNGRYCCRDKKIHLPPGQCAQLSLINVSGIDLLHYPSGDTDEPSQVFQTLTEGFTLLTEPGTYTLDMAEVCALYDNQTAPTEVAEQVLVCCRVYKKPDEIQFAQILQTICDKLTAAEPVNIAEILIAIQALCDKLEAGNATLISVLTEVQALCEKLLTNNGQITQLCTKLETLIENQTILIENQAEFQASVLECLTVMKDKLCLIAGDPDAPCPECDPPEMTTVCDVSWFMTYAQATFAITGLTIPGVETATKFTFPINGNSLPDLQNFQETVVSCLEAAGYPVEVQVGRDGWLLTYNGPCPMVTTSGEGAIDPQCENCVPVTNGGGDDLTGKTVSYVNSDDVTDLSVSVGGEGDIKFDVTDTQGEQTEITDCITACLAAGHDVQVDWTTVDGGNGSVTLLAAAETNPFPNFYNDADNATGDSGKVQMMVVTCL